MGDVTAITQLECDLRSRGLRPTQQRRAILRTLRQQPKTHFTAEAMHALLRIQDNFVSLATVYNTFHEFERTGLIRALAGTAPSVTYDSNLSPHGHLVVEDSGEVIDLPSLHRCADFSAHVPLELEVTGVDIIIRARRRPVLDCEPNRSCATRATRSCPQSDGLVAAHPNASPSESPHSAKTETAWKKTLPVTLRLDQVPLTNA